MILIICAVFYWLWIMPETDRQNMLSLFTENAHTGLANAPLTQVALGGNSPNSNLAEENKGEVNPAGPGSVAALWNPTVLFDISVQPFFGKNGMSPALLLMIIFIIPVLALFFLYLWNFLKKRGIKK